MIQVRESRSRIFESVADLPGMWDFAAGDNLFLRRDMLAVLEVTNPCGQRYHLTGQGEGSSIAVTYRHSLNLLTFARGSLSLPVTIVGVPCSVAYAGYSFCEQSKEDMLAHLHGLRGAMLILNSDCRALPGYVAGRSLPCCLLDVGWSDFGSYLGAMRSHYRHRITKAQSRWGGVKERRIDPASFGSDLYRLYECVYKRSKFKLERLRIDFFRQFPAEITEFRLAGRPLAFVQSVRSGDELIFMFTGIDYSVSRTYDTYLNILLAIVRKGIESGAKTINFGQTTEDTKCRLGCRLVDKGVHAAHSNMFGRMGFRLFRRALSYHRREREYNVFK